MVCSGNALAGLPWRGGWPADQGALARPTARIALGDVTGMQDSATALKEPGNGAVEIDRHDVGPAPTVPGLQGPRFAAPQAPQQPVVQPPHPKPAGLAPDRFLQREHRPVVDGVPRGRAGGGIEMVRAFVARDRRMDEVGIAPIAGDEVYLAGAAPATGLAVVEAMGRGQYLARAGPARTAASASSNVAARRPLEGRGGIGGADIRYLARPESIMQC